MIIILKILIPAIIFIFTSGIYFKDWGNKQRYLKPTLAFISSISLLFLADAIYELFKGSNDQSLEKPRARVERTVERQTENTTLKNPKQPGESISGVPASKQLLSDLKFGPKKDISFISTSPSNRWIAVSYNEGFRTVISLWDYETGNLVRTISDDARGFRDLEWSANGSSLFALGAYTIEGQHITEFHSTSNTDRQVAFYGRKLRWFTVGKESVNYVGAEFPVKIEGGKIRSGRGYIRGNYAIDGFGFFKPPTPRKTRKSKSLSLSPSQVKESRLRQSETQNVERLIQPCSNVANGIYLQPREQIIVAGRNCILLWNALKDEPFRIISRNNSSEVRSAIISPDGEFLILGTQNGNIEIWDTSDWKKIRDLRGHRDSVTTLSMSPNNRHLVSGGETGDGRVIVWDILTGKQIRAITPNDVQRTIYATEVSADGVYGFYAQTGITRFLMP